MPAIKPLGLIAGSGDLPLEFARQANERGFSLAIVALKSCSSPLLRRYSEEITWISIGQLGKLISFFKKKGIHKIALHGKVKHSSFFQNIKFDLKALNLWIRAEDRSGEGLMKILADELGKYRIEVLDGRFLMDNFLTPKGLLTKTKTTSAERMDIQSGLQKARLLARSGIGQSLVVKQGAVAAVEGMEGTDEMISRAGKWAGKGAIVVKVASPRQDWRFDVPTIGPRTIQCLLRAKARGIVLESGRSFLLNRDKTLEIADRNKIFIEAV